MVAALLPNGKQQFLDSNGDPLVGGSVFFYIPATTTFKTTWQDAGQTVANTNPVVLDAAGEAVVYGVGDYRQVVKDVFGNTIWDQFTSAVTLGSIPSPTLGDAGKMWAVNSSGTGYVLTPFTSSQVVLTTATDATGIGFVDQTGPLVSDATKVPAENVVKSYVDRVGVSLVAPLGAAYYNESTAVFPRIPVISMTGYFHEGKWALPSGPGFATPAPTVNNCRATASVGDGISTQGDLLYENFAHVKNWYNVWFTANAADTVGRYKITPTLVVAGPASGNTVTLNVAGENSYPYTAAPTTYQWTTGALVGVKVLVVTETVAGRGNCWSGRVATITANTNGTLTLDNVGTITRGDVLILLPNTDYYVWLFDAYWEDNSINSPPAPKVSMRNLGSTGAWERQSYGPIISANNGWPAAGQSFPSLPGKIIIYSCCVSPLARSIVGTVNWSIDVTAVGDYAEYYDQDGGNHVTASVYSTYKTQVTNAESHIIAGLAIAGSYGPWFYFRNAGSAIASVINHSIGVAGWIY